MGKSNTEMTLFEDYQIRRVYDEAVESWLFSVVDIIRVLTQQPDYQAARKYWNKLKERLGKEESQSVTNCHRLKLMAADGKKYLTVAAKKGGNIAKKARLELEQTTGKKVVTADNYLPPPNRRVKHKS